MEMISKSFFYLYNLKDEMVFIQVKNLNRGVLFNALYFDFLTEVVSGPNFLFPFIFGLK